MPDLIRQDMPRFPLGTIYITPPAMKTLEEIGVEWFTLLFRHARGDWGELSAEDATENEMALLVGNRLLSSYPLPTRGKVWIITEADRASTTILLPDDY